MSGVPDLPDDPAEKIARAVYDAGFEPGDTPFDDLSEDERDALTAHAADYIEAHLRFMVGEGFRITPPGATAVPKSDEEAAGMLLAVKAYRDGKKRKGGLLLQDKKLILPPGSRVQ